MDLQTPFVVGAIVGWLVGFALGLVITYYLIKGAIVNAIRKVDRERAEREAGAKQALSADRKWYADYMKDSN